MTCKGKKGNEQHSLRLSAQTVHSRHGGRGVLFKTTGDLFYLSLYITRPYIVCYEVEQQSVTNRFMYNLVLSNSI